MDSATFPHPTAVRTFAQLLSSTRQGARLARLLTACQLHSWGVPPAVVARAEQLVGELAANAVLHGCPEGRDFRLALRLDAARGVLRLDVTDTRGASVPRDPQAPGPERECGRGLLIVAALADRWGVDPIAASRKTVWAELGLGGR
ncbi:ATP-binding protein [Streptomyces hoynatensis]|uniref:ATP-binding protein n=1 Tax=Streptomyces hoynatensis TaxID=1141874 RepID=A0A3A9YSK2_9ACTN|nr:ATP-binding protein [Streptomyces hoynatensis]RKN39018.1 ATP-binding protein [Streptomyces hoynatensis]